MNTQILNVVGDAQVVGIICNQWGDTGKGKFVALLANIWPDYNIRFNGGDNAGHTDVLNGVSHDFHIMPSGILAEKHKEIYNIIGRGCVVNPLRLIQEMDKLESEGYTYNGLRLSGAAKVITPQHMLLDRLKDLVGSTGRGIGPTYTDEPARRKITINELMNPDHFAKRIEKDLEEKLKIIKAENLDPELIKGALNHKDFLEGKYYHPGKILDTEAIIEMYLNFADRLQPLVADTDKMARDALRQGKKILLEGAQGLLLSIKHGTYPYVTSSDCSFEGIAQGCGIKEKHVDIVFNIFKAPYMTRVGKGPFPTEFGGVVSADYCNAKNAPRRELEQELYGSNLEHMINSKDEFVKGIALRMAGAEYGVTTGRPRRTGRLDLPLLRYAMRINGNTLVMTKPDVMDKCDKIEICTHYTYEGPTLFHNEGTLQIGDRIDTAIPPAYILEHCKPHYKTFDGWETPLAGMQDYDALPENFKKILTFIEEQTGGDIKVVSTGAERDAYAVKKAA